LIVGKQKALIHINIILSLEPTYQNYKKAEITCQIQVIPGLNLRQETSSPGYRFFFKWLLQANGRIVVQ